jgi:Lon protease-like protein
VVNPLARLYGLLNSGPLGHELPLFTLNTVLFPGGRMSLKVFEARYLDMVSRCLREESPFGVALIKSGAEVGNASTPENVGCLARIIQADMDTPGVMKLDIRGETRFVVESTRVQADQLVLGQVRIKDDEPPRPTPPHCRTARDFLVLLAARAPELGLQEIPDDASWIGFRLAELLPLKNSARQAMLEMNDSVSRLEILMEFLRRNGLTQGH